jgi:hypothetical protein
MAVLKGLTYVSLEYFVYAAIVFAIAAFLFGVMVLILAGQEGARHLAAAWPQLSEQTRLAVTQSVKLLQPHKAEHSTRG